MNAILFENEVRFWKGINDAETRIEYNIYTENEMIFENRRKS